MAAPGKELHDIADPQPLLPGIHVPLWFWIGAVVVACAATVLVILYLRRRPPELPPEHSVFDEARDALLRLRESPGGTPLAAVATEASLLLRRYLATSLQEPALYETHEEFIVRSDALNSLPTGSRERLAPLLNRLAAAKYGPSSPDPQSASLLLDSCLAVLQGLESTRHRPVA